MEDDLEAIADRARKLESKYIPKRPRGRPPKHLSRAVTVGDKFDPSRPLVPESAERFAIAVFKGLAPTEAFRACVNRQADDAMCASGAETMMSSPGIAARLAFLRTREEQVKSRSGDRITRKEILQRLSVILEEGSGSESISAARQLFDAIDKREQEEGRSFSVDEMLAYICQYGGKECEVLARSEGGLRTIMDGIHALCKTTDADFLALLTGVPVTPAGPPSDPPADPAPDPVDPPAEDSPQEPHSEPSPGPSPASPSTS